MVRENHTHTMSRTNFVMTYILSKWWASFVALSEAYIPVIVLIIPSVNLNICFIHTPQMAIFSAKQFYLYSFNQDYLSSLYKDILHSALVYSRSQSIVDPKSGSVQNSFVDGIEKGNNMCYLYFFLPSDKFLFYPI